ncbi:tripartite tricarboxylate transporter substrate binding protein [Candidatus Formimonas warabiya]|uniref:Tripartite tricarboxylate transporter substrate binding protein n=1 Tax=Formimonas warabiya TaxID=1761012 RepID=A0A3G1KXV1_FORW1|nr:tripartite tricarboxylate transporter substrate binding protein [Candidatus Formimonas warabiya]ATW27189.1 hypothetical protein DCMF_22730 [Candidatus Formimonas warabiya]
MRKTMISLGLVLILTALLLGGCGGTQTTDTSTPEASQAEVNWPEKDITFIVPYNAGGGYDLKARLLAEYMPKYLPKQVNIVVKNVPGADAKIGTLEMLKSTPDGYTLALADPLHLALLELAGGLEGHDPASLAWIGQITNSPSLVVISANGKYKTLDEMKGQKVSFATSGDNIPAINCLAKGVECVPTLIAYNGYPEACMAVARGDVDVFMGTAESVFKNITSLEGKLLPVALIGGQSSLVPDVKTTEELGFSSVDGMSGRLRVMLAGPPDLDANVTKILVDAMDKAMHDPEFVAQAEKTGYVVEPISQEEVKKAVQESVDAGRQYGK